MPFQPVRRLLLPLALPLMLAACALPGAVGSGESERLQALFAEHWEHTARLYPEWASFRGDTRYGDQLRDASAQGLERSDRYWRELQARLRQIDRPRLSAQDRLSVELLQRQVDEAVEEQRHAGWRGMTVSAAPFAFQGNFAGLLRASPMRNAAQAEQVLARMAAYPRRVAQEIDSLRAGLTAGWVPPRAALGRVLGQLDIQLASSGEESLYFEPFTRLPSSLDNATRSALHQRGRQAVNTQVLPAVRALRQFVAGEYLAAAPAHGAMSGYPGGVAAYAYAVRRHTTTDLAADEIHRIGLREVARLQTEIAQVMRSLGHSGDFASFTLRMNTEPQHFYANGEELLAGYRDIAKRVEPELLKLFAELPRAPFGIRGMPAFMGPGAAESYSGPALDGSRPGWFNANVVGFKTRPKWGMETLLAHEAVPGHHLQTARAIEMRALPAFRRDMGFTAYGEGWALYAETLGGELGLYRDPASRFGFLQAQIFRAARLVVDTGLHTQHWSRERAIAYFGDVTGMSDDEVQSEIDRYIAWPGQALAYMIGQLKIIELRDSARAALGERFDIRRFHGVVLDNGPVPLAVLQDLVQAWVAAELKAPAPGKP